MCIDIIARRATNHADVRFWLGPVVEDDRALRLDEPAVTERPLQRLRDEQHRCPVGTGLRLFHDQQPVEKLDGVVLVEEAVIDQSRVLAARPAMQDRALRLLHGTKASGGLRQRQCLRSKTPQAVFSLKLRKTISKVFKSLSK